ncbi:MAG: ATP-binding cassette domain-containing protein [Deltaproteobacteria bacterium]|nr:ATP-binding cassette domain-containing protein [Deltaproteobacteria bacterium]
MTLSSSEISPMPPDGDDPKDHSLDDNLQNPASKDSAAALFGKDLTKSYGDVKALRNASISVRKGEVVALIGPNGSGKSTLLSCLAGLLVPDVGEARILGLLSSTTGGVARRELGFLSGNTALYQRLKVKEVLLFFASLYGLKGNKMHRRIEQVVDELELKDLLDRRCDGLSSGQEQRVNLARALVHDPQVLILDEPTNALDVTSQQFVLDAVLRAKKENRAVLFSSHVMGEVEAVADRVVLLAKGRIVFTSTLDEVKARTEGRGLGHLFTQLEAEASSISSHTSSTSSPILSKSTTNDNEEELVNEKRIAEESDSSS